MEMAVAMSRDNPKQTVPVTRRRAIKLTGSLASVGALSTVAAARPNEKVVRLKGSHDDPITHDEARETLEDAASSDLAQSIRQVRGVPEFGDDYEVVEFVGKVGSTKPVRTFYGAASAEAEEKAHRNGAKAEEQFSQEVTTENVSDVGEDWTYLQDDQATVSDHFGELSSNYEWRRWINEDEDKERTAIRSIVFNSDDTINPYDRTTELEHEWSASDLGNEEIHDAAPDTDEDDPITVSIGASAGTGGVDVDLGLSWDIGGSDDTHLDVFGADADWTFDVPNSGTQINRPGSHVVTDRHDPFEEQDVMKINADTSWGLVYSLSHTWTLKYVP